MHCKISRKLKQHLPEIEAIVSGSGARLVDKGDTWRALITPLAIGGIIGLIAGVITFQENFTVGVAVVSIIALIAGYFVVKRWRIVRALHPGELFLQQWPMRRGESIRVRYRRKMKDSISPDQMTARLQCVESATYQQGTDTRTVIHTLHSSPLELVEQEISLDHLQSDWILTIPRELPPSLKVYRNSVTWSVVVSLTFHDIPNDDSEFTLLVRPEVIA